VPLGFESRVMEATQRISRLRQPCKRFERSNAIERPEHFALTDL